jgi:hypothetical protein
VNPATGALTIAPGSPGVADYTDHSQAQNIGADRAFSGNIVASNGSFVEFDWMFDGVDQGAQNQAPTVLDDFDSGVPGDFFSHTFVATDPDLPLDTLTWNATLFGILGPTPAIAPVWNSALGQVTWDSTGSPLGTYIFQARISDLGGLTDVGGFSVTLVPEPATLSLAAMAFVGLVLAARRRRGKR